MRITRAYIHLKNIRHNLHCIRGLLHPQTKICVPVKADAYGHGAAEISMAAIKNGADCLAVAAVSEGKELRAAGIDIPILLFSLPVPHEIPKLIKYNLSPLVFDRDFIHILSLEADRMQKKIPVHLKIDTGMSRIGCAVSEAASLAEMIAASRHLALAGICTHFAVSDSTNPEDILYTRQQFERFMNAVDSVRKQGIDPGIVHCANSGAILMYPEMQMDMVRGGIIVYGYYPGSITKDIVYGRLGKNIEFHPVMEFKSAITSVRRIVKGTKISYGLDWIAEEDTDIAVIPVGYGDGLLRRYGHSLKVSIRGRLFPVVGRICMDQCMVDLGTGSGISRWDDVSIFGPPSSSVLKTAADLAKDNDTIPYEILCGINKRVPRIYID